MNDGHLYDCSDCVAFCRSGVYQVGLRPADVALLSVHLRLTFAEVQRRYTTDGWTLRHQRDPLFGSACVFLNLLERRRTVYQARPEVCRAWPRPEHAAPGAEGRCCYYDLYSHVRNEMERQAVPLVQIVRVTEPAHPATLPKAGAAGE
jgi:uncharacterized protein